MIHSSDAVKEDSIFSDAEPSFEYEFRRSQGAVSFGFSPCRVSMKILYSKIPNDTAPFSVDSQSRARALTCAFLASFTILPGVPS
jgi:hypothetical protein